jgi:hypothetical protein
VSALLLRCSIAPISAVALLWPAGAAWAVCNPNPAVSNAVATCTGTTINQGPGANVGYGGFAAGLTNLSVTVVTGATVTGTGTGIYFDSGTVSNFGTISATGGGFGIYGDIGATVTNSGTITGDFAIFVRDVPLGVSNTANVINSGSLIGATGAIEAGNVNLTNSGTISADGSAILAVITANVTNSGSITGGNFGGGIAAIGTANVTNSGTITGSFFGISAAAANVTNSGSIWGASTASASPPAPPT